MLRLQRAALVLFCGTAALGACSRKKEAAKEGLKRSKGGAAVVLVDGPKGVELVEEANPADGDEGVQALALDKSVQGTMASVDDVDRYSFRSEAEGHLQANLSAVADADLILELWDGGKEPLAVADRGPADTNEGIVGFPLEANKDYQLVVREFQKKRRRRKGVREGVSAPYRLDIQPMEREGEAHELEPNEALDGAIELLPGQEVFGYIGWNRDRDLWRLPVAGLAEVAPSTGTEREGSGRRVLDIELRGVRGSGLVLSLLDSEGRTLAQRSAERGEDLSLRFLQPAVDIEFYQLAVESSRSNPKDAYRLFVDEIEVGTDAEVELNDHAGAASDVSFDESGLASVRGELTAGDVDFFSIPTDGVDRLLDVDLKGPGFADLQLSVLPLEGEALVVGKGGGAGVQETLRQVPVRANESIVLKVEGVGLKAAAGYEMDLSIAPGIISAPAIPIDASL